jgi:general secretion pathway protein G
MNRATAQSFYGLRPARPGFTLVEILIVVVILGILAAIVVPQFANASTQARETSLREQRRGLRALVQLYRIQHDDALPDLVGTNWDAFTTKTDIDGTPSVASDARGPYIQTPPVNPFNDSSTVAATAGPNVGWVYDVSTGEVQATAADWTVYPE